jgi:hypothetical protein
MESTEMEITLLLGGFSDSRRVAMIENASSQIYEDAKGRAKK